MYVVPSDRDDENLDINGTIADLAVSSQAWFQERADGRTLRFNTYQGELDVTFLRLSGSDDAIGGDVVRVQQSLASAGFDLPNKLYAVYYGGADATESVCGITQGIAMVYYPKLNDPECAGLDPELVVLHEVLHGMGVVPSCAPNHDAMALGHVTDDNADIMFAGEDRTFTTLDAAKDDYYEHDIPGCLDLVESPFLEPTENQPFAYPNWPSFVLPAGIAVDAADNVYVADTFNHRIQKFTGDGKFLAGWGSEGSGNGQFRRPRGIAVHPDRSVYVADELNHRVQQFSEDGMFLASWGSEGNGAGQFNGPRGIAIDGQGDIYVADYNNHRVQKLDPEGALLAAWGRSGAAQGDFVFPQGVAVGSQGNVYVADTSNHRVQVFGSEGAFLRTWGAEGEGDGQFSFPFAIDLDSQDNVYVADTFNGRVQKLTTDGEFLEKWSAPAEGAVEFTRPVALTVSAAGTIYVSDGGTNRIYLITQAASEP